MLFHGPQHRLRPVQSVNQSLVLRTHAMLACIQIPAPDLKSHLEHYLGFDEKRGGGYLVPSLKKHIADELAKETAILKEKRKAKEARAKGSG